MESEIKKFFENKTIFLTGASGFLGRVIIEKLLRVTEVKCIYVLIRPKRGKDLQERIDEWHKEALFGVLLKAKPNALERIVTISGDCREPDLGISAADRAKLRQHVELVVHGAATVNFAEPLQMALDINTRATRLMLQLAKEMPRLVAFVHVSTAFSNCVLHHITERFYPELLSCSVDKVLAIREMLDSTVLDNLTPGLMDKFPNTYTYTKALAEQVVLTECGDLPVCIFRPGPIIATSREPVSGWMDNLYGPVALIYGVAFGVLRIAPGNMDSNCNVVPVDCCANLVLALAWRTAAQHQRNAITAPPTIYNYLPTADNNIINRDLFGFVEDKRNVCALNQAIWYPFMHTTQYWWLYKVARIFYHLLPGYIMDLLLRLRGERPRLIRIYAKIHKNIDVLHEFMLKSWSFDSTNTCRLWTSLSAADQQLFEFDLQSLDWSKYFDRALVGMRTYLGKDDPSEESLARARKKTQRFHIYHRLLQFSLLCLLALFLRWLFKLFL